MNISVLLDKRDGGKGPQEFYVSIGEGSSDTIDGIPFFCDLGVGANLVSDGGDTESMINVFLEDHQVTSWNRVLVPLDQNEGRGGDESWEDAEKDGDELLCEHGGRSLRVPFEIHLVFNRFHPPHEFNGYSILAQAEGSLGSESRKITH